MTDAKPAFQSAEVLPQSSSRTPTPPDETGKPEQIRWYLQDISGHIAASSRELLETYSHIPAEDVEPHIYKMVQ
jgi:hypothetical protein